MIITRLDDAMISKGNGQVRRRPLAVTGVGVYSSLGENILEFWTKVVGGECSVRGIQSFPTEGLKVRHAGEILTHDPRQHFSDPAERQLDWTAQFGIIAARQALVDAALEPTLLGSERLGLVVGVCAGGQGIAPPDRNWGQPFDIALELFPESSLYRQTDAIGKALGIHGVRSTISTACASSASAIGYAFDLLQAGQADAIMVGGADAFSLSTYAGFYALGAMAEEPMSPFSEKTGVSFGEGAGFVVLEPLEKAEARGARIYGLMLGYGCTGDAHHVTSPHPAGEGLLRAMSAAVRKSGLKPEQIDYVNAHGTATRDNDRAESSAVRELFKDMRRIPPVSSSKSQFGHTLGAAGVLEFIVSIMAQREGQLPPTVNYQAPRPGCDLDCVPNAVRPGKVDAFLSNSAAFGGINVSVLGGSLAHRDIESVVEQDEIWITGVGVVSPIGCGLEAFHEGLREGRCGIQPIAEFDVSGCRARQAALVGDFKPRKLAPTIDVRRTDPLNRYAMVAAALSLKHARLEVRPANCGQVGMVMSLNYGSLAVQERFRDSLRRDGLEKLSAKYFPSMVVSTVGGTVAQSFGLRGFNSTLADGISGGLQGLIHAAITLQQDDSQDATVVTAADEVASLLFHIFDQRGWLAPIGKGDQARLGVYASEGRGWILGEGAVSLVIERGSKARARGATPLARIAGVGVTSDATLRPGRDEHGEWYVVAIQNALDQSRCTADQIDLIYGHGRGEPRYDRHELSVLQQLFRPNRTPVSCVLGNTGVAAATSGLYSVVAAILSIQAGEAYPVIGTNGDLAEGLQLVRQQRAGNYDRVLVTGSTENGNNSALILSRA
jgi:3-oxoacyl-[acyl-carrier-protein] synthase II